MAYDLKPVLYPLQVQKPFSHISLFSLCVTHLYLNKHALDTYLKSFFKFFFPPKNPLGTEKFYLMFTLKYKKYW